MDHLRMRVRLSVRAEGFRQKVSSTFWKNGESRENERWPHYDGYDKNGHGGRDEMDQTVRESTPEGQGGREKIAGGFVGVQRFWHKVGYSILIIKSAPKNIEIWTKVEERLVLANAKMLNAIFKAINHDHLKLISSCEEVKTTWKILQDIFEGKDDVKSENGHRNNYVTFICAISGEFSNPFIVPTEPAVTTTSDVPTELNSADQVISPTYDSDSNSTNYIDDADLKEAYEDIYIK
ncbi:hypothetical protein Syun_023021 [Stephania yunnanensis]|uniref:Uncharacterized protein n=1 Tax=Stephania yunnanensis TaxID=152371 RepID=A0AAP0I375_9MAGN